MKSKEPVAILAKPNRRATEDRKATISKKEKEQLQNQLQQRTRVRRDRENGRRVNCFK